MACGDAWTQQDVGGTEEISRFWGERMAPSYFFCLTSGRSRPGGAGGPPDKTNIGLRRAAYLTRSARYASRKRRGSPSPAVPLLDATTDLIQAAGRASVSGQEPMVA